MHLGNGEVIDACRKVREREKEEKQRASFLTFPSFFLSFALQTSLQLFLSSFYTPPRSIPFLQGALGRFVNHSCEPNCETQKWLVRGELAIGLFALRDIKAGEELTFDYNFDRYGDKPMRCLCATPSCCGYIGGGGIDGEDGGRVAEEEFSDDEALDATHDPEPIMVDAGHGTGSSKGVDPALLSVMEAQVGLAPGETPLGSRKKKAAPEKPKGADSDDEDFDEDRELGKKKKKTDEGGEKKKGGRRRISTEEDDYDSDDDSGDEGGNRRPGRRRAGGGGGGGGGGRRRQFGSRPGGGGGGGGRRRPHASASIQQQQEAAVVRYHKRRSEVDRRLDALLAPSGRLRDASVDGVVSLLRLFNLCDVAQDASSSNSAFSADGTLLTSPRQQPVLLDPALPPSIAALAALEAPANAAGRRRARLADLSLLLDVVLKTQAPAARRELARCGALRQLQAVALRCSPLEDAAAPVLRKALRAAEALPLDAAAVHARASAQGSFGDALVALVRTHGDAGVRARAQALLARWPPPRGSAAAAALASGPVPGSRAAAALAGGGGGGGGGLSAAAAAARLGDDDDFVDDEEARERKRERKQLYGEEERDRGGGGNGSSRPLSSSAARHQQQLPPPLHHHQQKRGPAAEMPPGIGDRAGSQPAADAPPPPPMLLELGAAHLQQQEAAAAAAAARFHQQQQQQQRERSGSPPPPPPDSPPPDDDDEEKKKGTVGAAKGWGASSGWGAAVAAANPPPPLPKADDAFRSSSSFNNSNPNFPPDAWPHPTPDFEAHVRRLARALCDRYSQPEHPLAIPADDAAALAERAATTIVESERSAARARAREGAAKPIDRRKLEAKAAEFVRVSVRRFHEKRAGLM